MTFETREKGMFVPEEPDEVLVQAAIDGDCGSFTELCKRYYPAMVAIAYSVLRDKHLSEDAAQQTFAKAVRKLPQLKKKGRVASWLAAICRNAAWDIARAKERLSAAEDFSAIAAESNPGSPSEIEEAVRVAITELSLEEREIICLRYYEGLSYERISAVLGFSEQAINGRLRRAKRKIADYLKHNGFVEIDL